MKKLYSIVLALLVCSQSVYGMKRVRHAEIKNRIVSDLNKGNLTGALKTHEMYKGVFPRLSFSASEKKDLRNSLVQEIHASNEELVNDSFSALRSNFWWILPASATLIAAAQTPVLIGLGVIGSTLGSFGFKKQCDYQAKLIMHQKLCAKANTLEEIFTTKEKAELK